MMLAIANESDGWLDLGREYVVLEIVGIGSSVKLRVVGEGGIPALHPVERFEQLDTGVPEGWKLSIVPNEGWRLFPFELGGDFWVRFFDGESSAEAELNEYLQRQK